MGLSMAGNLVKSGFVVKGCDLSDDTLAKAKDMGIHPTKVVAEAAVDVDFIVSSLPRTSDVEKVLTMKGGVFENASPDTMILDTSTISPIASKELAKAA